MSTSRILVVEDDFDISNMLELYFGGQGYEVDVASRGEDALEKTKTWLPHLIVLDIMLPDMDGYEVCRRLRTSTRTGHIPIIFLTQMDDRSDKIQGLELGADDYITKPFDIEELKLRVSNAISRADRDSLTDPRSGLPSGRVIEEQLRLIIQKKDWTLLDVWINHFDAFKEVYGFVAADDFIRSATILLGEIIDKHGTPDDFIGHPGDNNFVVITTDEGAKKIQLKFKESFQEQMLSHYNFIDREKGFIKTSNDAGKDQQTPLMNVSVGTVSSAEYTFSDIREIIEMASEARRND
ncbi:MAG: response regulator [Chloroflexota bacterium]